MRTPTTAANARPSEINRFGPSVDDSFLKCSTSCSTFTMGYSHRHAHDVLVGLDEFVPHLDGHLKHDVGLLQRDHGFVHVAAAVDHVRDGGVGRAGGVV